MAMGSNDHLCTATCVQPLVYSHLHTWHDIHSIHLLVYEYTHTPQQQVHQETKEYRALITQFREAPGEEWEGLVASNRPALTGEFFSYLENTAKAAVDNQEEQQSRWWCAVWWNVC